MVLNQIACGTHSGHLRSSTCSLNNQGPSTVPFSTEADSVVSASQNSDWVRFFEIFKPNPNLLALELATAHIPHELSFFLFCKFHLLHLGFILCGS
jgi:hypothetical protein